MGQLDEVSHSIGRIEGKLDSLITEMVESKKTITDRIESHDRHLELIKNELAEKRGASIVWGSVAGFAVLFVSKILEHIPQVLK